MYESPFAAVLLPCDRFLSALSSNRSHQRAPASELRASIDVGFVSPANRVHTGIGAAPSPASSGPNCRSMRGTIARRAGRLRGLRLAAGQVHDALEKQVRIDWLREVIIETGLTAALHIVFLSPAGQRDQSRAATPAHRSHASGHFVAAQVR